MIKLTNTRNGEFILLKNRARDYCFYATRNKMNAAIQAAKNFPRKISTVEIYSTEFGHFVACPLVTLKAGLLRLGCHRFDRKTSRVIIHWAAGK